MQEEREAFQQAIEQTDPKRLIYIDEFGFHLNMTPRFARAPSCERAFAAAPFNRGANVTLVMGLGLAGVVAPCAFEGGMSGYIFGQYMAELVLPQLPPDAIVIVDNLSAHHSEDAREELEARGFAVIDDAEDVTHDADDSDDAKEVADDEPKASGIQVWFLPAYSPELSAVEECGSKIKTLVRAAAPRTMSALIDAMGHAIGQVTQQDARGWLGHARSARAPRARMPKGAPSTSTTVPLSAPSCG